MITIFITKGHYSVKIACGVTVLLCILSNHGLHLYQVSRKYLERFLSYGADLFVIDRQTHNYRQTNCQQWENQYVSPLGET